MSKMVTSAPSMRMRLAEFESDGATAQHDQVLHPLCDIEDGFVGEIRHFVETRDRGHERRTTRGDHEPARPHEDASRPLACLCRGNLLAPG